MIKLTKTEAEIQEKRDYRKELRTIARNPDIIKFPKELKKELDALSETIPKDEIAKRRDFRHLVTCTIDPDDAQDFDDALSVEKCLLREKAQSKDLRPKII